MALSTQEILDTLNETYEALGWAQQGDNFITEENISTIGVTSPNMRNKFIEQLNICLQNRFWKALFSPDENDMRKFTVDIGKNGWGLLDTYQKFLAGAVPMWDDSKDSSDIATDLVTKVSQELQRKYYTDKMQIQFKQTVDRRETEKLFTMEAMSQFINNQLGVLTNSLEYWLMTEIIGVFRDGIIKGDFNSIDGFSLADKDGVNNFVWQLRAIAKDMEMPSTLYNKDGTLISNKDAQTFIVTNHFVDERVKVYGNASNFNMGEADINIEKLFVPYEKFSEAVYGDNNTPNPLTYVLSIVLDRRAIMFGIRTYMMTHFRVANTLWENYWLSLEGIKGYNTFFNCVVFKGSIN